MEAPPKPIDPVQEEAQQLPAVPSPYEGIKLTAGHHFKISAYWFATNFIWGALLVIMLPKEVRALFPEYRVPAIGYLLGIGALVALFIPLIVGALSDRCASKLGRRRPYMIVGVAMNVIGLILMWAAVTVMPAVHGHKEDSSGTIASTLFTSPTFIALLVAFLVAQFGNNIASAAYSGVIPDLVPEDQRGTASGWMALMTQCGTLLGAVGCGLLLGGFPEAVKYTLLIVVLVGVASITITGIQETPLPDRPPKLAWGPYVKSLWISPKRYPDFAWVWITRAFVMLGFYAVLPFINYYLIDVIRVAEKSVDKTASMLIGVILITSSLSGMYGGSLSDRIGRKKVVYIANVMMAVMTVVFIFCSTIPQVLAVGVLFGLGFGAYTSVDWALGTDVLPSKKDAAKEMGVWHIAMTLPQAIAAPLAGLIIAKFGMTVIPGAEENSIHYTTTGYAVTFAACAVLFALGAFFLRNVRGVK